MITQILQHNIKYTYFYWNMDLSESEEEHIKEKIIDGYSGGELCYFDMDKQEENRGWWEIV